MTEVHAAAADGPFLLLGCVVAALVVGGLFARQVLRHVARASEFEQANVRLDAALNNMALGLSMFDRHNRLRFANRRMWELFGIWPVVPPLGITYRELVTRVADAGCYTHVEAERVYARRIEQVKARLPGKEEFRFRDDLVLSIGHQPTEDGGWTATYEDVTDRVRAEEMISHMTRHDGLTGLPNRASLRETLDKASAGLDRDDSFALLFIDLDDFKTVNDVLGFPRGDRVLQEVAGRLVRCVRRTETVARLGADEFAVLVPGLHRPEDAGEVARRVSEAVRAPCRIDGAEVQVCVSIGVVMAPMDGQTSDDLLRKGDLALQRAKLEGRGSIGFFEPGMDARQQARRAMEADLREGLNRREFQLLYQPLLDLRENRVLRVRGAAALGPPERSRVAGRVHPGRRGHRPDRADRRVGADAGLHRSHVVARRGEGRGQRLPGAVP